MLLPVLPLALLATVADCSTAPAGSGYGVGADGAAHGGPEGCFELSVLFTCMIGIFVRIKLNKMESNLAVQGQSLLLGLIS